MKRMKSILAILLALLVLSAAAFAEEIVPVEAPAEPAVETPVEASVEPTVEAPAEEPAAPAEEPAAPAEEPAAPVETPTEAPVTSEPTVVPATPAPTDTPAPTETPDIQVDLGDATGEEIEIEDEAEAPKGLAPDPVPFTGSVRIEVLDGGQIYFGDRVTLVARVANASADYDIRWEVNETGRANDWHTISNETQHQYDFIITPENADFNYRVVLTAAA